jgi:AcrR family transcriptional regulator
MTTGTIRKPRDPVLDRGGDDGGESKEGARATYHHGDLRAALIAAATRIVSEKRVEAFSVADAARAAGVSSGAPYRHFADRDDLLDHVAAAAFETLHRRTVAAFDACPPGSVQGLIAGGCAYVDFSADNPELFHLMWGATRPHVDKGVARETGDRCHSGFIERFTSVLQAQGLGHLEPYAASAPLWAMVHGYASLLIGPVEKLPADRAAIHASVAVATRAYLAGLRCEHGPEAMGPGDFAGAARRV